MTTIVIRSCCITPTSQSTFCSTPLVALRSGIVCADSYVIKPTLLGALLSDCAKCALVSRPQTIMSSLLRSLLIIRYSTLFNYECDTNSKVFFFLKLTTYIHHSQHDWFKIGRKNHTKKAGVSQANEWIT